MNLIFVSEIWEALNHHIDFNERGDAADTLVSLLIDNNYEPSDIKESFRGDREIINALKNYAQENIEDEDEDLDNFLEDDEEDW